MIESIYVTASIAVFAMIGLLTAYVHQHGELAGTIFGGLGGIMLAFGIPALLGTQFMEKRRKLQCAISVGVFVLLLVIVYQCKIL